MKVQEGGRIKQKSIEVDLIPAGTTSLRKQLPRKGFFVLMDSFESLP
jgi:hypothetical protein